MRRARQQAPPPRPPLPPNPPKAPPRRKSIKRYIMPHEMFWHAFSINLVLLGLLLNAFRLHVLGVFFFKFTSVTIVMVLSLLLLKMR